MSTIGSTFDARANGLNQLRLILAASVVLWHSFPLTGEEVAWPPLRQLGSQVGVDGFFAISGFLIVRSWDRRPKAVCFLLARALRIFPGLWVCLLVTGLIIAPLATGRFGPENLTYPIYNAALWVFQYGIAGDPTGVPHPGVWNGSLWTLPWEFVCYLGVVALGLLGLLRRKATLPILFVVCALTSTLVTTLGIQSETLGALTRFGTMFLAGSLVWRFRHWVPINYGTLVLAGALVVSSLFLPNYRLLAALPLAYLLLSIGALVKSPGTRFRNDVSYGLYIYAMPIQQVLAMGGLWREGPWIFALSSVAITLPIAAVSWLLVERPCLGLKRLASSARAESIPAGSAILE